MKMYIWREFWRSRDWIRIQEFLSDLLRDSRSIIMGWMDRSFENMRASFALDFHRR